MGAFGNDEAGAGVPEIVRFLEPEDSPLVMTRKLDFERIRLRPLS